MSTAFIYIDESHTPAPAPHERGKPFRVGVLVTETAIESDLVDSAMTRVRALVGGTPRAQKTLDRGYFHANEDHPAVRALLYDELRQRATAAHFCDMQWHHERGDDGGRDAHEVGGLHPFTILLGSLSFFDDDYDALHIFVAVRDGSFTSRTRDILATHLEPERLGAFLKTPTFRSRFPAFDITVVDGAFPGAQVCDAMLWAAQRESVDPDAIARAGLRRFILEIPGVGASVKNTYELGQPVAREFLPRGGAKVSPQRGTMPLATIVERFADIEDAIRRSHVAAMSGPSRISHHAPRLENATAMLEGRSRPSALYLAETFLLICDTLPVYDPNDERATSHACEMKLVAAFLSDSSRVNSVRTRDAWDYSLADRAGLTPRHRK